MCVMTDTHRKPLQVHGTQSIEILKPIPEVSGPGWKLKKRIVGVSENSTLPRGSNSRHTHEIRAQSRGSSPTGRRSSWTLMAQFTLGFM